MTSLALKQNAVVQAIRNILDGHRVTRKGLDLNWNPREFALHYLSAEFESKIQTGGKPSDSANAAALRKFYESEHMCSIYNRFGRVGTHVFNGDHLTIGSAFNGAKAFIKRALGPLDIEEVLQNAAVTNGATTRLRRRDAHPSQKLGSDSHATPYAWSFMLNVFPGCKSYFTDISFRTASKLEFVPKTTRISRIIAKEPCLNMFLQRGIGIFIRSRLAKFGIDLHDQCNNRTAARIGSADGSFATIDLSSASDNLSTELVRDLLPYEWFCLLNALRTKEVQLPDGTVLSLEKFSMSGNGFIFELETLIFLSLARQFDPHAIVYGDDIIIRSEHFHQLEALLTYVGSKVNVTKSFHSSHPFRESCGFHGWKGYDVTPFYVRTDDPNLEAFVSFVNKACEWIWWSDQERASLISLVKSLVKDGPGSEFFPFGFDVGGGSFSQLIFPVKTRFSFAHGTCVRRVQRFIRKVESSEASHIGFSSSQKTKILPQDKIDRAYISWLAMNIRPYDMNNFKDLQRYLERDPGLTEITRYKPHCDVKFT